VYVGIGNTLWQQGIFQRVDLQGRRLPRHPLLNLNVYPSIRSDNVAKVVMDDNFVRDDVKKEMHVFKVWHGGVEVKIGKVDAQKLCPRCTDGGIDEEFDRGELAIGVLLLPG
jgi:hypothetical protein